MLHYQKAVIRYLACRLIIYIDFSITICILQDQNPDERINALMDTKTSNEETHSSYKDNNGNLNHLSLSQKEPLHEQLKQYTDTCEETANKLLQKNNLDRYILNFNEKPLLWITFLF